MNIRKIFIAPILTALAACGAGSGGSDSSSRGVAPERPSAQISGTGFDGLIINGDVHINDFSKATVGALLGTTVTDASGKYSASIQSSDTAFRTKIGEGFYIEEASGLQIQLDPLLNHELYAVDYYQSGSAISVSATFFTTLATGYVEYLVHNQGLSVEVAIEQAYAEIDAWAGFNTRRTVPLAVNDVANASPFLSDELKAGFVAAGISQLTRVVGESTGNGDVHLTFSSIGFIQKAYQDIKADGVLNGRGIGGDPLSYGSLLITEDTYRTLLSTRLLQFVNTSFNQTGLQFEALQSYAVDLNTNAGPLFNYQSAEEIQSYLPTLDGLNLTDSQILQGTESLVASVSDIFGVESVSFIVDGQLVGESTGSPFTTTFDTTLFLNGSYDLTIEVTNLLGNTNSEIRTITINNGTVEVTTSDYAGDQQYCGYRFALTDTTGLGLKSLTVNEYFSLNTVLPPNGVRTFSSGIYLNSGCVKVSVEDYINAPETHYMSVNMTYQKCKEWDSKSSPFGTTIQTCVKWDTHCSSKIVTSCN